MTFIRRKLFSAVTIWIGSYGRMFGCCGRWSNLRHSVRCHICVVVSCIGHSEGRMLKPSSVIWWIGLFYKYMQKAC